MGCFCHAAMGPLSLTLPQLNLSASLDLQGASVPLGLSAWLNLRGLPCLPWEPLPAWLTTPLPPVRLSMTAVASISALATLRAQALAQFGLDLLNPVQARAFARIIATMNARLSAIAHIQFNPLAWLSLARLNSAIDQVQLALRLGLLPPGPNLLLALTMPGGVPFAQWGNLLNFLRLLAPMIAACAQLNIALHETVALSAMLRVLARIQLPALAAPQFMATLSAALSAIAQLQLSLNVAPLALGFPALRLMVQAKLNALLPTLRAQLNVSIPPGGSLLQFLLSLLPDLPLIPTSFATAATVQAAFQAQALAALNWQVSVMPPVLGIGLPALSFAANLQAALNIAAVLPKPCADGCDAEKIMKALESVAA